MPSTPSGEPSPVRQGPSLADMVRISLSGLRARPLRGVLASLGIAIGVAAMVAVVAISASSQERINSELTQLGTNLLTVSAGETGPALPHDSRARLARISGVEAVATVERLDTITPYRNRAIDPEETNGLIVAVPSADLLSVLNAQLREGQWLSAATSDFPTVVLGPLAAERLGISQTGTQIWLGDRNATVIGIADSFRLAPELDSAAFVGAGYAAAHLDGTGEPTTAFERSTDESVERVRELIGPTLAPNAPGTVQVSRPSDLLQAKAVANDALNILLLAVGSIALLVGGIGVANTMIIAVLERQSEIGLRRALGATRSHIRNQFVLEAVLLSAAGGIAGAAIGAGLSVAIAVANGWTPVTPLFAPLTAVGVTIAVGAIAGAFPALRAARTPPTAALAA